MPIVTQSMTAYHVISLMNYVMCCLLYIYSTLSIIFIVLSIFWYINELYACNDDDDEHDDMK